MELLSIQTSVLVLVLLFLFFSFRPSWVRSFGTMYSLDLRQATMSVVVRRNGDVVMDITSTVEPGDIAAILGRLDRAQQGTPPLKDRVRLWHVAAVLSLVGAVVALVATNSEQNHQGAWTIIGAVVGVLIKPTEPDE